MDNQCSLLDPWQFREPWMTDSFARENAALARALQISISSSSSSGAAAAVASPDSHSAATSAHPFAVPQSQAIAAGDRRRIPLAAGPGGRVSKRKRRASKRSPTTYINADPENFREMVQRITGGRASGGPDLEFEPVVRPEPVRPVGSNRSVQPVPLCLPTLDTSAFLLDQVVVEPVRSGSFEPGLGAGEPPGFDFDALLPCFPTLESWGVM